MYNYSINVDLLTEFIRSNWSYISVYKLFKWYKRGFDMNRHPITPKYSLGSKTFPNYFSKENFLTYTVDEVEDKLLPIYDDINISNQHSVTLLLRATSSFLRASTLDTTFRPSREKHFTDAMIKKILDDIGLAFMEAIKSQEELKQKNGITNESKIAVVLSDAIKYCMICVEKRFRELSDYKDRIFLMYESHENNLKKVMPSMLQQQSLRHK